MTYSSDDCSAMIKSVTLPSLNASLWSSSVMLFQLTIEFAGQSCGSGAKVAGSPETILMEKSGMMSFPLFLSHADGPIPFGSQKSLHHKCMDSRVTLQWLWMRPTVAGAGIV